MKFPTRSRKPIARSTKPIARKAVKRKARKASEFNRIYGGKKRVEWIKSLPCVMCGIEGYSENAHIVTGGTGRKADYTEIVPLCGPHPSPRGWLFDKGNVPCHELFHRLGRYVLEATGRVDFDMLAAHTEQAWLDHTNKESK